MDISCNFSYNLVHPLPLIFHVPYQLKLGTAAVQVLVFCQVIIYYEVYGGTMEMSIPSAVSVPNRLQAAHSPHRLSANHLLGICS